MGSSAGSYRVCPGCPQQPNLQETKTQAELLLKLQTTAAQQAQETLKGKTQVLLSKTKNFRIQEWITMYVLSLETPSESKKPARTNQNKDISLVGTSSNNKENRVEEGHAKTQENKATVQTPTLTQQVNNSRKLQVKD